MNIRLSSQNKVSLLSALFNNRDLQLCQGPSKKVLGSLSINFNDDKNNIKTDTGDKEEDVKSLKEFLLQILDELNEKSDEKNPEKEEKENKTAEAVNVFSENVKKVKEKFGFVASEGLDDIGHNETVEQILREPFPSKSAPQDIFRPNGAEKTGHIRVGVQQSARTAQGTVGACLRPEIIQSLPSSLVKNSPPYPSLVPKSEASENNDLKPSLCSGDKSSSDVTTPVKSSRRGRKSVIRHKVEKKPNRKRPNQNSLEDNYLSPPVRNSRLNPSVPPKSERLQMKGLQASLPKLFDQEPTPADLQKQKKPPITITSRNELTLNFNEKTQTKRKCDESGRVSSDVSSPDDDSPTTSNPGGLFIDDQSQSAEGLNDLSATQSDSSSPLSSPVRQNGNRTDSVIVLSTSSSSADDSFSSVSF